mgnify:CR=1 FL=1
MTVTQLTKLIEAVGIPAATAAAMGFLLWRLLQYILKDLRSDMQQHDDDLQRSLKIVGQAGTGRAHLRHNQKREAR